MKNFFFYSALLLMLIWWSYSSYRENQFLQSKRLAAFIEQGAWDELVDFASEAEKLTSILKFYPDYADAYYQRGVARNAMGNFDQALGDFNMALKFKPDIPEILFYRGIAKYNKGDFNGAEADLESALQMSPDVGKAFYHRGIIWFRNNELNPPVSDYDAVSRIDPVRSKNAYKAGIKMFEARKYRQTIQKFSEAIEYNPLNPEAINFIAYIYATCPDDTIRDGETALDLSQQAIKFREFPHYFDSLAAAYGAIGDFANAVITQEKAISLLNDMPINARTKSLALKAYREHLQLYRLEKPFLEKR